MGIGLDNYMTQMSLRGMSLTTLIPRSRLNWTSGPRPLFIILIGRSESRTIVRESAGAASVSRFYFLAVG